MRPPCPVILFALLAVPACSNPPAPGPTQPESPQSALLGEFRDDYGDAYTIAGDLWVQQPRSRYHIVAWNTAEQYLIAQNDSTNPSAPGRWTRIDWMPLSGMPPYQWAFCLSAYDAPTRKAAEAVLLARRDTPKTGCNGYPFTRMRRLTAGDETPPRPY